MFKNLPSYPRRRDSTFWSTRVPGHWVDKPGLAVLRMNRAKNTGLRESQVLSLSYGRVVVRPVEKQRGLVPESYEGYQVLSPGDIVVRPTDLQNDQTSIRVGHVRHPGIITAAYLGLSARAEWSSSYAYQYLSVVDSTKRLYGMGTGLRQQLGWNDLKRMPCLVPPADEQAAIVKYLGHANARIDKAIIAKRRLIALLDEQQRALIEDRLSEGNYPRERLGLHIDLLTGFPFKSHDFVPVTQEATPLLRGVNVGVGKTVWRDTVYVGADLASSSSSYRLAVGDLVLGMDRPVISAGVRLAIVDDEPAGALLVQRVARLRTKAALDGSYLAIVFRSAAFESYLEPIFTGISVPHLSPKQIRNFMIPMPGIDEQKRIVSALKQETQVLDEVSSRLRREIELLQELCQRLVSDVVTGQVDVRAISATLPDAPDSFENLISAFDDELAEALSEGDE